MDLKDFIKQTLVSFAGAIVETNKELKLDENLKHCSFKLQSNEEIDFDVAVTTSGGSTTDAGGKVSVIGISVGAGVNEVESSEHTSRIKFSVKVFNFIA